jgi:hypothetical protein
MTLPIKNKSTILGQLWIDFREDEMMSDFIEYNDIGMPMAYFLSEGLVTPTVLAEEYVNETWALFLEVLNLSDEDVEDVEDLSTVLEISEAKKGLDN